MLASTAKTRNARGENMIIEMFSMIITLIGLVLMMWRD